MRDGGAAGEKKYARADVLTDEMAGMYGWRPCWWAGRSASAGPFRWRYAGGFDPRSADAAGESTYAVPPGGIPQ